jgi:hypothetical protein
MIVVPKSPSIQVLNFGVMMMNDLVLLLMG